MGTKNFRHDMWTLQFQEELSLMCSIIEAECLDKNFLATFNSFKAIDTIC